MLDVRQQAPKGACDQVVPRDRQMQSANVVLPTMEGRELRVHCVIKASEARAAQRDRLGIDLPLPLAVPRPSTPLAM